MSAELSAAERRWRGLPGAPGPLATTIKYFLTVLFGMSLASAVVAVRALLAGLLDPAPATLVPAVGMVMLAAGCVAGLAPKVLERLGASLRGNSRTGLDGRGWLALGWLCLATSAAGLLAGRVLIALSGWNRGWQQAFLGPELNGQELQIDKKYVNEHLQELVKDYDLSKYIL